MNKDDIERPSANPLHAAVAAILGWGQSPLSIRTAAEVFNQPYEDVRGGVLRTVDDLAARLWDEGEVIEFVRTANRLGLRVTKREEGPVA